MEITHHLNHSEMEEFLATPTPGVGTHLELCDACLNETSSLREALRILRVEEPKPESFWLRQADNIDARIARWESKKILRPRPMWRAAATAAALLLAATLWWQHAKPAPVAVQRTNAMQDHELLLRVEQSVSQNGPEALAPAAMLAQEISPQDFSDSNKSNSTHKGEQQP